MFHTTNPYWIYDVLLDFPVISRGFSHSKISIFHGECPAAPPDGPTCDQPVPTMMRYQHIPGLVNIQKTMENPPIFPVYGWENSLCFYGDLNHSFYC